MSDVLYDRARREVMQRIAAGESATEIATRIAQWLELDPDQRAALELLASTPREHPQIRRIVVFGPLVS